MMRKIKYFYSHSSEVKGAGEQSYAGVGRKLPESKKVEINYA